MSHHPVVSRDALWHLTKRSPKPVRSREEHLVPFFALLFNEETFWEQNAALATHTLPVFVTTEPCPHPVPSSTPDADRCSHTAFG